jgi:hypothetical protein
VHEAGGVWAKVKVLGADQEDSKKSAQRFFKSKKNRLHICKPAAGGDCPEEGQPGLHMSIFHWYPPGDFQADWLSRHAQKSVEEGKKLCLEEERREPGRASGLQEPATAPWGKVKVPLRSRKG